jgi:hypothetical protein
MISRHTFWVGSKLHIKLERTEFDQGTKPFELFLRTLVVSLLDVEGAAPTVELEIAGNVSERALRHSTL